MTFKDKNILITGGAGFIGSNLALKLVQEKANVSVIDSLAPGCGGNLFNLNPCQDKIRFVRGDAGDSGTLMPLIKGADFVFSLAGNVSHEDSMRAPFSDMELNLRPSLNVLEICKAYNREAVVLYSSTRQFYGTPQYLPVDENHAIEPLDINGIHKLAAEQYHSLYNKVYGLKTVSLRLTNTYGPRQLICHAKQGVMGWFAGRAVTGNTIELFGGGEQKRDFTFVEDVVEAMLLAVQSEKCFGDSFNLSGEVSSLKDVATKLTAFAAQGSAIEIVPFPPERKKIDIGSFYGTSKKFFDVTGWAPKTNLETGLKNMADYFLRHKEHYLEGQAQ